MTGLEFLLGKQMPYVLIAMPTRSAGRHLDISVGCQFSQSIRPSADDLTIPMPFGRVLDDSVESEWPILHQTLHRQSLPARGQPRAK